MRLIDADALKYRKQLVIGKPIWYLGRYDIERAPTIDPGSLRPKGHWIEDSSGVIICSNCGEEHEWDDYRASFCEYCGADMRKE